MSAGAVSRRWLLRQVERAQVDTLCRTFDLPRGVARVLAARGLVDEPQVRRFLEPRLAHLSHPRGMADLNPAAARIAEAVLGGERIGVFGDYDVDGVTSAALVADYLTRCGAEIAIRVARRDEGYGFHAQQADELIARGCTLMVLTDCGTSDVESVGLVAGQGVDVIAVDHHRVAPGERWPGYALINPQRPDCEFPYKGLCSAGLAFYLMAAVRRQLEQRGRAAVDPRDNLDLVALGTIADVAPLDGDNRILVARGLQLLARSERPGVRELLRLCEIEDRIPTVDDVGWRIGPRLNAPGRLGDAAVSLECLRLRDERAIEHARRCDAINTERREIQRRTLDSALAQAERQRDRAFVVVAAEQWHPGVIGIVAGRLVSELGRPAAVVALEGDRGRGSARSVEGIDLFALLQRCGDHLVRYGGHAAAAGFTVGREQIPLLSEALHRAAEPQLAALSKPEVEVDALMDLGELNMQFCRELARLGPHGPENPRPLFAASGVSVESVRPMGSAHMALTLAQGETRRPAVGFGMLDEAPASGATLDVAFVPEIDHYRGPRLRLRLAALAPAGQGVVGGTMSGDEPGGNR